MSGIRSGKNVDPTSAWHFFFAIDVDNRERLRLAQEDAIYIKFLADVIAPNVTEQFIADFEMEPGRSITLS